MEVGVGLALLVAGLNGASSIFARKGLDEESYELMLLVSLCVAAPSFLLIAFLTTGFSDTPQFALALIAVSGVVGSVGGRGLYFLSIDYVGPGKALSFIATSPLFVAGLSVAVLAEDMTLGILIGTALVVLGVTGTVRDSRAEFDRSDRSLLALTVPFASVLLIAASVTIRKYALNLGIASFEAGAVNMTTALLVVAPVVLARRRRRDAEAIDRRALGNFFVASILLTVAFMLYFVGLRITPANVFFPLIQTQPIFAVTFSALFLGGTEVLSKRTAFGAVLIVIGAALISLS